MKRLLVTAAADGMPPPGRILIAGLGVGFSLAAALAHPAVSEVHVVEREPAVLRWNRRRLPPPAG
jgi:spermidine synthase